MAETGLKSRLDAVMIRGKGAYGRKPPRSVLREMARAEPVDVHHYDDASGMTTVETLHDPNPVIDDNVAQYLSGHDGYTPSRDLQKVATIPMGEVLRLYQMGIDIFKKEDWPKIAQMLDSAEWQKFRTAPGVVSSKPRREYLTPRGR